MPKIEVIFKIKSSIEICFDLSRSIDFHKISTATTNEEAIAGRTSGLIELNEYVTWRATHFGIRQTLTSKITAFNKPYSFVDQQIKGPFKSLYHKHTFQENSGGIVTMIDSFEFQSPFGIIGKAFENIILIKYMKKFLVDRNNVIKEYAETDKWRLVLEK